MDIRHLRKVYDLHHLEEKDLETDPFQQFSFWFDQVLKSGKEDPNAVVLATCDDRQQPSARMVLLKGLDERGFIFFTNYQSRKGEELFRNPKAALLFFWSEWQRQVRVEGRTSRLSPEESDAYFASRPAGSRISTLISPQSREIPSRKWLEERALPLQSEEGTANLSRPDHWGGFLLVPESYEFWQGRENRLHDRILYKKHEQGWRISRLAP